MKWRLYASETRKYHNSTQPKEKQNGRTEFLEKVFAVPILLIYCQLFSAGSLGGGGGEEEGHRSLDKFIVKTHISHQLYLQK